MAERASAYTGEGGEQMTQSASAYTGEGGSK